MPARTLKSLNMELLTKQLLSTRASGRGSVLTISKAAVGINSQDFRESFSSYWARSKRFEDDDMLNELKPRGGLARTWTVRGTVHTFPTSDYYLHVFGSGRRRVLRRHDGWARQLGVPGFDVRMRSLYEPLMEDIRGTAVTSDYIKKFMIDRLNRLGLKGEVRRAHGWSNTPTLGPLWTGMVEMSYLGLLVNAGRRGSESLWMRASDWLSSGRAPPDPQACSLGLVREYIRNYGPVTRSDIAFWNNNLLSPEIDDVLSELEPDLMEEKVAGSKETHFSLGDRPDVRDPPQAVILPEFDSLIMGFKDRSRILDPRRLGHVSRPQGVISRTILLGGFVAATWGKKRVRDRLTATITPFRELRPGERRAVEGRFAEYAEYLKMGVEVVYGAPTGA